MAQACINMDIPCRCMLSNSSPHVGRVYWSPLNKDMFVSNVNTRRGLLCTHSMSAVSLSSWSVWDSESVCLCRCFLCVNDLPLSPALSLSLSMRARSLIASAQEASPCQQLGVEGWKRRVGGGGGGWKVGFPLWSRSACFFSSLCPCSFLSYSLNPPPSWRSFFTPPISTGFSCLTVCAPSGSMWKKAAFLSLSTSTERLDKLTKVCVCVCVCDPYTIVCISVCFKSTVTLLLPSILCSERKRVFWEQGLPW